MFKVLTHQGSKVSITWNCSPGLWIWIPLSENQWLVGVVIRIGQDNLLADHPLVVDQEWSFKVDSCQERIIRNDGYSESDDIFRLVDLEAAQVLERDGAAVVAQHDVRVNDRKRDILIVQRLQPLKWMDFFVFNEDVLLMLGESQHPFTDVDDCLRFVFERPERLCFQFQRNGYLR